MAPAIVFFTMSQASPLGWAAGPHHSRNNCRWAGCLLGAVLSLAACLNPSPAVPVTPMLSQTGGAALPLPTADPLGTLRVQSACIPTYPAVPERLGWRDSAIVPSPDGTQSAQSLNPAGRARLQVTGTSGTALFSIEAPNPGLPLTAPVWAPDGGRLAFANVAISQPGGGDIYVVDNHGAGLRRVVTYTGYHDTVAWSPDGRFLAFTSGAVHGAGSGMTVDDYAVYTAAVDGASLPSRFGPGCDPAW